jgi:membrane protease YdiL (CAAX protease family)
VSWDFLLIFLFLGVVVPWRGRVRLRELVAKPQVGASERIALYLSTIAFQWIAAGVVAWRGWAHGFRAAQLGLTAHNAWTLVLSGIFGAGVIATLQWLNLRRMGRPEARVPAALKGLAQRILPQSTREMPTFFALAFTAGVCEEFIYRGFTMAVFTRVGLSTWMVVLVSSVLFGLAHLYQGRGGLLGTMILGALFGAARIGYDSLIPVILWHAAVDVVAGIAGPRYLVTANISTVESVT